LDELLAFSRISLFIVWARNVLIEDKTKELIMKIKMMAMALVLTTASSAMAAKFTIYDSLGKGTAEGRYNLTVTLKNNYTKQSSFFKGTRLVNDASTMAVNLKMDQLGNDGAVISSTPVAESGDDKTDAEGYIKILNSQEIELALASGNAVKVKAAITQDSKGEVSAIKVDGRNLGAVVMGYSSVAKMFLGADSKMRIAADVSDLVCQRGDKGLKCKISVQALVYVGR
jgi:hypothetical protein